MEKFKGEQKLTMTHINKSNKGKNNGRAAFLKNLTKQQRQKVKKLVRRSDEPIKQHNQQKSRQQLYGLTGGAKNVQKDQL